MSSLNCFLGFEAPVRNTSATRHYNFIMQKFIFVVNLLFGRKKQPLTYWHGFPRPGLKQIKLILQLLQSEKNKVVKLHLAYNEWWSIFGPNGLFYEILHVVSASLEPLKWSNRLYPQLMMTPNCTGSFKDPPCISLNGALNLSPTKVQKPKWNLDQNSARASIRSLPECISRK